MTRSANQDRAGRAKDQLLLAGLVVVLLLPFVTKPVHMDDPLFLWTAQQIERAPLRFFDFDVAWFFHELPVIAAMKNPPLSAYGLALVGHWLGYSEVVLHLAYVSVAVVAALGIYRLAAGMTRAPLLAALVAVVSPAFVVSATTLMCDIPMLALWVWSIVVWREGRDQGRPSLVLAGAILAGLAGLTKYFGACVVLLLAADTMAQPRRQWWPMLFLSIPVGMLAAYEWYTRQQYGIGLLGEAATYATGPRHLLDRFTITALILGLSFTGGSMLPASLLGLFTWSRTALVRGSILVALLVAVLSLWPARTFLVGPPRPLGWQIGLELGLFVAAGLQLFWFAVLELGERKPDDADALLLGCWFLGTLVFASFLNWTVNVRSVLPMLPAAAILAVRRWEDVRAQPREGALAPTVRQNVLGPTGFSPLLIASAALSMAIAWGDWRMARAEQQAAAIVCERYGRPGHTLWFQGHWGFQYYMQNGGALPFGKRDGQRLRGDYLVLAAHGSHIERLSAEHAEPVETIALPALPGVATVWPMGGAGFYSDTMGPLPFAFGFPPPFTFELYRLKHNIQLERPSDGSGTK